MSFSRAGLSRSFLYFLPHKYLLRPYYGQGTKGTKMDQVHIFPSKSLHPGWGHKTRTLIRQKR